MPFSLSNAALVSLNVCRRPKSSQRESAMGRSNASTLQSTSKFMNAPMAAKKERIDSSSGKHWARGSVKGSALMVSLTICRVVGEEFPWIRSSNSHWVITADILSIILPTMSGVASIQPSGVMISVIAALASSSDISPPSHSDETRMSLRSAGS